MKPIGFKNIAVIEINGNDYHFALYDKIYPGDSVLVTGASSGKVLVVKDVITNDEVKKRFNKDITQEVVCRVYYDSSNYIARSEKRKRISELKNQIEERINEINKTRKYEVYTNADEEVRDLYKEYKKLIVEQGGIS